MKVGDLVRYKNAEFVTTRVHEEFVGLVVKNEPHRNNTDRTVCVKWNSKELRFRMLWHNPETLEIIKKSS